MTKSHTDGVGNADADSGVAVGGDAAMLMPSGADGLVPVFMADIGGTLRPAVDARELYQFLGSKQDFSSWIKRRFREYGFVEGDDYASITKFSDGCKRDKNNQFIDDKWLVVPIEYHLKLDVAKDLAMVEKNERGRAARQYFIDCEGRLLAQLLAQAGQTEPEAPVNRCSCPTRFIGVFDLANVGHQAKQACQNRQGVDVFRSGQVGDALVHDHFFGQAIAINGLREKGGRRRFVAAFGGHKIDGAVNFHAAS